MDPEECPGADAGFRDHLWAVSGIRHRFVVSKYRRPRRYGRSILDEDLFRIEIVLKAMAYKSVGNSVLEFQTWK